MAKLTDFHFLKRCFCSAGADAVTQVESTAHYATGNHPTLPPVQPLPLSIAILLISFWCWCVSLFSVLGWGPWAPRNARIPESRSPGCPSAVFGIFVRLSDSRWCNFLLVTFHSLFFFSFHFILFYFAIFCYEGRRKMEFVLVARNLFKLEFNWNVCHLEAFPHTHSPTCTNIYICHIHIYRCICIYRHLHLSLLTFSNSLRFPIFPRLQLFLAVCLFILRLTFPTARTEQVILEF